LDVSIIKSVILLSMLAIAVRLLLVTPRHALPEVGDRVVVDYWEKWTGREAAAMQEIIELFNDTVGREKGIFVRYLSMSNIQQKTLVSTAAGVPPDLAGIFEAQLVQFAALDALEPLDDLAAEYGLSS
jgi:multiple sugar transport system substrate-binding protein